MQLTILKGDNIDLLKQYPDNYFDSVVTDCPYGLGKEPNALKLLQDWIDHGYHEIKGKGFMGKNWDAFVPQPIFWKEVYRVLKPGGYVLAFFGTRTYDWGTMAIRLAGFEVRDAISWLYGSGFPKSLDISKQLDKNTGAERKVIGTKGLKSFNGTRADKNKGRLGLDHRTYEQANSLTAAECDAAKQWEGWGTALKPAQELICVARKPLQGTVADNVLKHGTGGINIDGCRIEFQSEDDLKSATFGTGTNIIGGNYVGSKLTDGRKNVEANSDGRWPANVILDPFMANELDEQTGITKSGKVKTEKGAYGGESNVTFIRGISNQDNQYGDSGGTSRFFYTAKASQEERNAGLEGFEKFVVDDGRKTPNDTAFQRGITERFNTHPTVKPIALMRYLLRLVTPPGGKTLDTFAGSGTTGCAAYFEDIGEIVLMELDEQGTYIPIIEARTAYWAKENNRRRYLDEIKIKPEVQPPNQTSLF